MNPLLFPVIALTDQLEETEDSREFADTLSHLESMLPISGTCSEVPWFVLTPPTMEPRQRWMELLRPYGLDPATFRKLFRSAFMPLDQELLVRRSGGIDFLGMVTKNRFVPLDLDYGVTPFSPGQPTWNNFSFTRRASERYAKSYREVAADRTNFLSIGEVRLRRLAPEVAKSPTGSRSVKSREELDALIALVKSRLAGSGYEIWFRGQTADYLLDDFSKEARSGFCPWRGQRDSSLVPSLYRVLPKGIAGLKEYARFCKEYALASLFLQYDLHIPDFAVRAPSAPKRESLNSEWYRGTPTFSAAHYDKGAKIEFRMELPGEKSSMQYSEADYVHDYDPVYRGLQKTFFLQHYGLPSNGLDVTSSLDVALFFAQTKVLGSRVLPVRRPVPKPVVYLFLLRPGFDVFASSQELSEEFGLLRPLRQECGMLAGASLINRNDYARFISMKVRLDRPISYGSLTPEYLFPTPAEDTFLERLLRFSEKEDFRMMKPWVREG